MGNFPNGDGLTAIVFPGQGSQKAGMRDIVEHHRPELLELATELTGGDPFERIGESTRFAQPAIYCASIACWTALGQPRADLLAGHSLGEVAALVAAGALTPADGLRLVATRGEVTARAAREAVEAGMLAVIAPTAEELARLTFEPPVVVANDNSPTQVVLAGPLEWLRAVKRRAVDDGLRAILLPVEGAFHTPAMQPAVPPYAEALAAIEFHAAHTPVYSGVTAGEFTDCRLELANSLVSPVRWREVTAALYERGVRRVIEPGPGEVVSKLMVRQEPRIAMDNPDFTDQSLPHPTSAASAS